jgi:aspartyl-tRNA(Asn)/glutamyl-tRNA(Gln) amidotransferase subunit C
MISKDEVKNIAKLARLKLTENEVEKMQKDLSSILDYFNVLKKADTKKMGKIKKEFLDLEKVTRKDKVMEQSISLANNLVQAAPDKKDGYIKVKSIL